MLRRERNRVAMMMMMKAEEEEKENVGAGLGALQGSRLLPLSRPQPLSDVEDYTSTTPAAARRHLAHVTPSFLPDILGSNKPVATNKVQPSSPSQLTQYWTYAAGHGGSVEHWKKLARKAELEMHLEQEQHKSDREKDLDSIHRLRCRTFKKTIERSYCCQKFCSRPDMADEVERSKRQAATEKVKDYLAKGDMLSRIENKVGDSITNPLRKLALFQVDLLVNTKTYKQLEVSGINGGLTQAAIHYFTISQQYGEITFENGNLPGSQSSNMLAELMLLSANDAPIYETKAGDILGLSVKVKGFNDKNTREILFNTNVIRTDEVMEAIKGQPIDNFSLWPDLVSSWKWERSTSKGWVLVCIKWRFLFKNIFPEISEPLQVLSIKQAN